VVKEITVNGNVDVTDEHVVVMHEDQEHLFNRCCGCGLWHKIEISRENDVRVRLRFENLGYGDIDVADHGYDRVETHILTEEPTPPAMRKERESE